MIFNQFQTFFYLSTSEPQSRSGAKLEWGKQTRYLGSIQLCHLPNQWCQSWQQYASPLSHKFDTPNYFSSNLIIFGGIWWYLVKINDIWSNLMRSGQIWWDLVKFDEIWSNLVDEIWSHLMRLGKIWWDLVKFDEIWAN